MALVPLHPPTERKRETNERDQHHLRKNKEKADYYRRNPHKKWND